MEEAIRDGFGEEMPEEETVPADEDGQAQAEAPAKSTTAETKPEPVAPPALGKKPGDGDVVEEITAAPGIAIGPVFRLLTQEITVTDTAFAGVEAKQARLQEALETARTQLSRVGEQSAQQAADEAAIFEVHAEILDDQTF